MGDPDADVIGETRWQDRRLVIAHNAARAAEQSRVRREAVEALDALGQHLAERLNDQDARIIASHARATTALLGDRYRRAQVARSLCCDNF